jgi:protein-L-isoaspartate(D-aspartate) O-methyltransferase
MSSPKFPAIKTHDPAIGLAMRRLPRPKFVPTQYQARAYEDAPLPIGHQQTISQPSLVAYMTDLLELHPGDAVLEVGTGSGYQTALLAELGYGEVYSIEVIPELARAAAERLQQLGYTKIHLTEGDGYLGWAEHAPYNAIIVTAAAPHLPPPLVEQLAEGGRLVLPIGPPDGAQTLWKYVKAGKTLHSRSLGGVAFVPLTQPTRT